jgi:hypothetical protein
VAGGNLNEGKLMPRWASRSSACARSPRLPRPELVCPERSSLNAYRRDEDRGYRQTARARDERES